MSKFAPGPAPNVILLLHGYVLIFRLLRTRSNWRISDRPGPRGWRASECAWLL